MENKTNKKTLKLGAMSTVTVAVAIAVVVIVNLIVGTLPSTMTKLDTSSLGLYTIGEQSEQIIAGIDTPVTVYLVATKGYENLAITELLDRYAAKSSHITVKSVDPITNPAFTLQYTEEELEENSLIVESEKRFTVVPYEDIYVQTFSEEDIYNYMQYGVINYSTAFAGEGAITTALDYVTTDTLPVMYRLTGHNETAIPETMAGYISDKNIDVADLSLLAGEIPEDASAIYIGSPQNDITADELTALLAYIEGGGKILMVTDFGTDNPNLNSLAASLGLNKANGIVVENSADNYYRYQYYIIPNIGSHDVTEPISENKMYTLMPTAFGITEGEHGDDIEVTGLLTTSKSAIAKIAGYNLTTMEREEGDIDGPFMLGAIAENSAGGSLVWYSSSAILDDQIDSIVSGGNSTLFLNTVSYLTGKTNTISINSISLDTEPLVVNELAANIWSALLTIILPVGIMICGFLVWNRRRKV